MLLSIPLRFLLSSSSLTEECSPHEDRDLNMITFAFLSSRTMPHTAGPQFLYIDMYTHTYKIIRYMYSFICIVYVYITIQIHETRKIKVVYIETKTMELAMRFNISITTRRRKYRKTREVSRNRRILEK